MIRFSIAMSMITSVSAADDAFRIERLEYLQQKSSSHQFYDVGHFSDRGENILLSIRLAKNCKSSQRCQPLIWRAREGAQVVQYESYSCKCDKQERILELKEARQEKYERWVKRQEEYKQQLEDDQRRWRRLFAEDSQTAYRARQIARSNWASYRHRGGGRYYRR